ncbi:MAG: PEP-CTERM sorting domain-containing protein [Pirellulales bacterium]
MQSISRRTVGGNGLWRGDRLWRRATRHILMAFSFVGAAAGVFSSPSPVWATNYFWISGSGGLFTNPGLWTPFNPPAGLVGPGGATDTVNFSIGTPPESRYTVTGVTGQNLQMSILDGALRLDVSGNYTVPNFGVGTANGGEADLLLTGSGHLQTTNTTIGGLGTGLVTVDTLDWDGSGNLVVASSNTGTLVIQNGADVSNDIGRIAFGANRTGSVTVTGAGSTWTNSGELEIGGANGSMATLTVQNGADISSNTATIARDANANGTVTVTGAGSTWTDNGVLIVGRFGDGTLTINAGADVASGSGVVGDVSSFGGTGTVTVENAGSTWTNSGSLVVGNSGVGTLTIEAGGSVSNINGFIGDDAGSDGTVRVFHPGTTWTNTGALHVGVAGAGELDIKEGTVTNTGAFIGELPGSTGEVFVAGASAQWLSSFGLAVGYAGTGTLDIADGGFVSSLNGHIGSAPGSSGTVTVSGAGSRWLSTTMADFDFNVGRDGTGTLHIKNGGEVESTSAIIGFHTGSVGAATVEGAGSTWTNNGPSLIVGFAGTGALNILAGGDVTNGNGFIGSAGAAVGNVTVNGNGSTWTNSGEVRVGSGALNITSGGAVSSTSGYVNLVDGDPGQSSAATVDGPGSTWTSGDILSIAGLLCPDCGDLGEITGTLTVQNGGDVSATNSFVGPDVNSNGTATIGGAGSTWNTNTLSLGGDAVFGGGEGGAGTLDILPGATVTVAQNTILFTNGTLALMGGTLDSPGIVNNGSFDFLSGTLHAGNFLGNLVNEGGSLAPGHSAGRTSIFGDYTQQTDAVLDIEIGGISFGSEYDHVEVTGTAVLDGVLQLSLINPFVPNGGHVFGILEAGALSGAFTNVANGERLDTIDGLGSFLVHYGPGSAFPPNRIFLTDFELSALPGDYNGDGAVDAADYVVWRKFVGAATLNNRDPNGMGPVGQADYDFWRMHFGETIGSGAGAIGSASAAVPEPTSPLILIVGMLAIFFRRRAVVS